jgi:hypothetical protein
MPSFATGLSASATFTDIQTSPGVYSYSITLNNIGTTTIGTFWFAWVPGDGFLFSTPISVSSPAGWTDTETNSGSAIRWTTSTPIAAGHSLSGFDFVSTDTPAELLGPVSPPSPGAGDPSTTSFVYIAAPFGDPGDKFAATEATPEPSSVALTLMGVGLAVIAGRKKLLNRDR